MTEGPYAAGPTRRQLVFTVKDRCRVCYTCLRECPAKAIKISNGQAEVIHERCIGCGNCVKVCSQDAKVYLRETAEVNQLLKKEKLVIACVAPSFPAEFIELNNYQDLVGMIRALGFSHVTEVSFGADMVAKEYKKLMENKQSQAHISSDCPAIVYFIEHYFPDLVPYLAPIVSPMVAMARIVRKRYGHHARVVFIGPCISKKAETNEVDHVLTFRELRELLAQSGICPSNITPSDFDPPFGGKGSIFPISGGLLQTSEVNIDLCEGDILVTEGRINIRDAIKEFEDGMISTSHLELLCCEGCIMGPGMSPDGKKFSRRNHISRYVHNKLNNFDEALHREEIASYRQLNLTQKFAEKDRRISRPDKEAIQEILLSMGKKGPVDLLNCGACGYDNCEEHAIAIIQGLAENEMCLPYAIEKLHKYINKLNVSNEKLASAQLALQQSEKLASMGQLSAGIAHELNNPLGVITMYSNILMDEAGIENPIHKDLELIVEQADRCKKIVGGLLNFARKNQVNITEVNINLLMDRCLSSIIIPQNVKIAVTPLDEFPYGDIDADQMTQVITNLLKNAIEAMPEGGEIKIIIEGNEQELVFSIQDNGGGIHPDDMNKLFTPFFTTKGIGKGTGLGLPIVYGIVKMHKGNVTVVSNNDPRKGPTGTIFRINLPRQGCK
ncbi:MAG: [Fe-Fe] hydrogenase large subunit C-terminal domain-containing protein [Bacteroidota bacterium]